MTSAHQNAPATPESKRRLGSSDVLVLAVWCGLAAGELEVAARAFNRSFSSTNRLYVMTRHFVWVVPLVDLLLFLGMGMILAATTRLWPRRAGWLSPRLLGTLAIFPALLVAGRPIYPQAWLIFAMGIASCLAMVLERHRTATRRWLTLSLPVVLGLVLAQAGLIVAGDRLKQWREEGRPPPPAGSPNVLLIVLDTVRADHLSLHGYERGTSPALERLAARGIRFDQARAAAPWTLASHATMFTGRWPHELAVRWLYPLRANVPILAEYLGTLGYATAGFVANTLYCSYDSGLDRGFTHYEDYVFEEFSTVRTAQLVDIAMKTLNQIGPALARSLPLALSHPLGGLIFRQFAIEDKKTAAVINREFLDWLSRRREPRRPFFAFLNYADAHTPYVLPPGTEYRFGPGPQTEADFLFLLAWTQVDKQRISPDARALARNAYDDCLAYLDLRLGELFDELQRRGVLDQTVVIVTADHGEGLGEHDLFDHGQSVYRTEIRVPLVVVLPAGKRPRGVVDEPASLRDLPATIADLVSPGGTKSPFPGRSLTRFWREPRSATSASQPGDVVLSELASPNPIDPNQGRSPAYRGPLISLAEGDFVYIRNEGDGSEELFNERDDTRELTNRATVGAMFPVLQRFRDHLNQLRTASPTVAGSGEGRRVTLQNPIPLK
jgi:arylsulfatase A-like enzyme